MAKAAHSSKKKKSAGKSPAKKKAAAKKTVKKAAPEKKAVKKKAVKKIRPKKSLKRTVSRPAPTFIDSGTETESIEIAPVEPQCKCKKKNGVFFLMVKQKNGKYKESPLHSPFETLAECEANCINE